MEAKLRERDLDSTLRGVCQTCHSKIYLDEVFHTPSDYASETQYSGQAGGGGIGSIGSYGIGGAGGVAWQGKSGRHDVTENWIQCGFCYTEYFKDKTKYENWHKWSKIIVPVGSLLGLAIGGAITYFVFIPGMKESRAKTSSPGTRPKESQQFEQWWLQLWWLPPIGGLILGSSLAWLIFFIIFGRKPEEPNRYKPRVAERKKYDN